MKIDPLVAVPTFDMNARLTTLNITQLNDFLKAYGNFDAEKGAGKTFANLDKVCGSGNKAIKHLCVYVVRAQVLVVREYMMCRECAYPCKVSIL